MTNFRFAKNRLVRRLELVCDEIGVARGLYWQEARTHWSADRAAQLEDRNTYLGDVQDHLYAVIYELSQLPRLS